MTLVATLNANSIWLAALAVTDLPVSSTLQTLDNAAASSIIIEHPVQLDELAARLDVMEQVLLCYQAAEQRIAAMLLDGYTLQQAATQWQAETSALLNLQRQHRRKLKLLNLQQITQATAEQLADLQPYWPLTEAVAAQQLTVEQLAARLLLSQNPALSELNLTLQVSSLTLTDATDFDIEAALQNNWAEQAQLKTEVATLREQYQQVEQLYQANAQTAEQLQQQLQMATEKHQQDVKQQEQIAKQHKQHLADAAAENELTLKQLMQVQEQYESLLSQLEASENRLKQQQAVFASEVAALQQALDLEEQKNKEHQLTAQQELSQTQQENELVLSQLFKVQEELERYYLDNKTIMHQYGQLTESYENAHSALVKAEQQLHKLQTEKQQLSHSQKQLSRELARLQQKHSKQRAELSSCQYQLQQTKQQLLLIQGSASWKLAAPVRVLSRAVKKVDKAKQRLQQEVGLLFTSEYFDAEWYLNTYPDVKESGANPAEHYLKFGAAEGRLPSADFDGNWYLQRYPDVAATGINPLLHFIKFGRSEGRTASPKLLEDHSEQPSELSKG